MAREILEKDMTKFTNPMDTLVLSFTEMCINTHKKSIIKKVSEDLTKKKIIPFSDDKKYWFGRFFYYFDEFQKRYDRLDLVDKVRLIENKDELHSSRSEIIQMIQINYERSDMFRENMETLSFYKNGNEVYPVKRVLEEAVLGKKWPDEYKNIINNLE